MWYWHKDRHRDQWNTKPRKKPSWTWSSDFWRSAKIIQWGKGQTFQETVLGKVNVYSKRMKLDLLHNTTYKTQNGSRTYIYNPKQQNSWGKKHGTKVLHWIGQPSKRKHHGHRQQQNYRNWTSWKFKNLYRKKPFRVSLQNRKILNSTPLTDTLNVQLHMEKFPSKEI